MRAFVKYVQPIYTELKESFDWVSNNYHDANFEPIDCCKGVSREDREIHFEYFQTKNSLSTEEILAKMDELGLRPALYEEFICFVRQNPDEQRIQSIVALGSVLVISPFGVKNSAFVRGDAWDRGLYMRSCSIAWGDKSRFLAVKK